MANDNIEVEGKVIDMLPGAKFKIKLLDEAYGNMEVLGHLSGKMRMHYIKLVPGDYVRIDISIYDLSKGRITYRFRPGEYEQAKRDEANQEASNSIDTTIT